MRETYLYERSTQVPLISKLSRKISVNNHLLKLNAQPTTQKNISVYKTTLYMYSFNQNNYILCWVELNCFAFNPLK